QILKERRTREWNEVSARYRRLRAAMQDKYERDSRTVQEDYRRKQAALKQRHDSQWAALIDHWRQGLEAVRAEIAAINGAVERLFPDWEQLFAGAWAPPREVPPLIRFGRFRVDLAEIPNGEP